MASKIRVLDEKTINQIAAGEVIENPASVVKELVDNAIDAKASKIVVEAINSGRQLLRIQDNGCGMGHDDALLCIERHATSKIRSLDDLWALETMGFRGEALSSVASISEFRLLTAPNDNISEQLDGSLVEVHGGKVITYEKVKCLPGTTIEIKSLFYNVPARKKFLKSPAKDASSIVKIMLQMALAHPHVAFELILNHQREFSWDCSSLEDRIRAALGNEFFSELIPVNFEKDDIRIHGYIANPNFSRPTRSHQYLFVNVRPVTSLGISSAVKEAYGTSLDPTRHPAFVLYIDVATSSLDVNVHPQKKEVRFSLEDELKQLVIQAVSRALFSRHLPVSACSVKSPPVSRVAHSEYSNQRTSYAENSFSFRDKPENHVEYLAEVEAFASDQESSKQYSEMFFEKSESLVQVLGTLDDYIFANFIWPRGLIVPQELQTEGLFIISAKRALSRLAFDGATHKQNMAKGSIQTLLVPVFVECTVDESSTLRTMIKQLEDAGISISDFGKNSFLVQAIPSYLESSSIGDILKELVSGETHDIPALLAKACKNVVSSKPLTVDEASHIINKLLECANPFYCPAGEKIACVLSKAELEKKFR